MSFLLDPPALIIIGVALYFAGRRFELERLTKITIGLLIVFSFILFSGLLYANFFSLTSRNMTGPEFMLHTSIWPNTGIQKENVPLLVIVALFALYPLCIYFGYASALLITKARRKALPGTQTYKDVKSRERIAKFPRYSAARYPDDGRGIKDLKDAVEVTIKSLGGMDSFIRPKDKVLIKVNICGGIPDNSASYTSKEVVEYVVDMVREAGGEPIICDADMIWAKFWDQAKATGWSEWADKKDVKMVNLSETDLVQFDFGEGSIFEDEEGQNVELISKAILDADVIISIPKMKTHLLTGVTLGMKNMYGTLPDTDKSKFHQKGINEVIYWLNYAFAPTLTIIDGSEGGEAIGPLSVDSVPFKTIVASNNVTMADAIAAKLMGYGKPFEIEHLKMALTKERPLLNEVPGILNLTTSEFAECLGLPSDDKDCNWQLPNEKIAEQYENLMENMLMFPHMDTFFNIGADFILFDAARIPLLKYFNHSILQFMYEIPRFWTEKRQETKVAMRRKRFNRAIYHILAFLALLFFVFPAGWQIDKGYLGKSLLAIAGGADVPLLFILSFVLALYLGRWFAQRMKTRHLETIISTSLIVAYFVESFSPPANWWKYNFEVSEQLRIAPLDIIQFHIPAPPRFALFVIPVFIIIIIGFTNILRQAFAYVDLNGMRFRLVPYVVIMLSIFSFLYLEHYLDSATQETHWMIIIYAIMSLLGLYFNERHSLDWNITMAVIAVLLGGTMEIVGALSGFWSYPLSEAKLPMFVSFTWALNTWAACGLAQIFSIDISRSFVE
jgi:uncharacterized protein (DUF362 family)